MYIIEALRLEVSLLRINDGQVDRFNDKVVSLICLINLCGRINIHNDIKTKDQPAAL